jgi:hypothetical protein
MIDKKLILQLKALKNLQPKQEWVVLTKEQVFGGEVEKIEERVEKRSVISLLFNSFVFQHKLAFSSALLFVMFIGVVAFAQSSVPGDSLFALKKITEKGQAMFVPDKDMPKYELEMVTKRLNDLTKIARSDSRQGLASALSEYKATVSQAAKSITNTGDPKNIIGEVKQVEEKQEEAKSFGVQIEESKDLDIALAQIVERELNYLESTNLSDDQLKILEEAEADYIAGSYSVALEKLLTIEEK